MVTAAEVAKMAGVSTATVSRVMAGHSGVSEATRTKVLRVIEELNYVPNLPAQLLVKGDGAGTGLTGVDKGVGIIVSTYGVLHSHAFFSAVIEGIEEEVVRQGKSVSFLRMSKELREHGGAVLRNKVDGLVFVGTPPTFDIVEAAKNNGIPTVLVEFWYRGFDSIIFDRDMGMKAIIEHLVDRGHKRIGYLGGPDRMNSFVKVMGDLGMDVEADWCDDYDGWTMEVGYENGLKLLDKVSSLKKSFTAMVTGSDDIALGFIRACKDRGIGVPSDISIASFDNSPMSGFVDPRLTSVDIPKKDLGVIAVRRLMERIAYENVIESTTVCPVKLVIRESVAQVCL